MAAIEDVRLLVQEAAVVQVRGADEQAVGRHEAEQMTEIGSRIEEMLDHFAGHDDREPSRGRKIGVDELGVVAQLHDVGDGDTADLRQGCDVVVVVAPARPEDQHLEVAAPEDIDRHLGHMELPSRALQRADPATVGEVVDLVVGPVVERVLGVADVPAHAADPHLKSPWCRQLAPRRRRVRDGHDPGGRRPADEASIDGRSGQGQREPRPGDGLAGGSAWSSDEPTGSTHQGARGASARQERGVRHAGILLDDTPARRRRPALTLPPTDCYDAGNVLALSTIEC